MESRELDRLYQMIGSLNVSMQAGFRDLSAQLDAHAEEDRRVANRVLVIETNIAAEERQSIKRSTWAGLLAATGMTAAIELAKELWKP